MSKIYTPLDIFGSGEFSFLRGKYTQKAWAYVRRGDNILIGTRATYGARSQLTVPGGDKHSRESYLKTAMRETWEETGLKTRAALVDFPKTNAHVVVKPRDNLVAILVPVYGIPEIWICYRDGFRRNLHVTKSLVPANSDKPRGDLDEDLFDPKFEDLRKVLREREKFRPNTQILLEVLDSETNGVSIARRGDVLVENSPEVYRYLQATSY